MEKGQTFQEFTLTCAKAFGALIHMRDEPWDAPITLRPKTMSGNSYHVEAEAAARVELNELLAMDVNERLAYGERTRESSIKSAKESLDRITRSNATLDDMRASVLAWTPPTADHQELKAFMLDQLAISSDKPDYYVRALKEAESTSAAKFYEDSVNGAQRSVAYHAKNIREDAEKAKTKTDPNAWIIALFKSLDLTPPTA